MRNTGRTSRDAATATEGVRIASYCITDRKLFGSTFDWGSGPKDYEAANMFDEFGEETTVPEDAVSAVFEVNGKWLAVDLREFISIVGN